MKRFFAITIVAIMTGSLFLAAQQVDEAAPALHPTTWLNGDPVDIHEPDRIFIVEIWATWCPHCVEAIGEIAEIQDRFAEYATVVAVAEETESTVREFIDEHPTIDYPVAVDPDAFALYRGWDGVPGIPHAFVILNGIIRWHGHPASRLEQQVYHVASEVDPSSRLVEAAACGDMDGVRAALALGADPNREVVAAYGSERGDLHARPVIDFPGFIVSGADDYMTAFEAAVIFEHADAARLLRERGGKGDEELMHRAAVLLGEAEEPPSDVRLRPIERNLTAEEFAPLVGEWIYPRGLESDDVMAREVVREDGTGEFYNHILDEAPTFTYTFEVTRYDEKTGVYSVILHLTETQEMRCLVRVSGLRREWIYSWINSGEFPERMDPSSRDYILSHPRGPEDEPLDPFVGSWKTKEVDRESRTVYSRDGTGEYYFHSGDDEPSNRFIYDIVWRNPETGVFYLAVFFREWQWFNHTCRIIAGGTRMESAMYGQNQRWFAPEPKPGEWYYTVSLK